MYSWASGTLRVSPTLTPATLAELRAFCTMRSEARLARVFSYYLYFWPLDDGETLRPLDAPIIQGTVYANHFAPALGEIANFLHTGRGSYEITGSLYIVGEARRMRTVELLADGNQVIVRWCKLRPGTIRRESEAFAESEQGRALREAHYSAEERAEARG